MVRVFILCAVRERWCAIATIDNAPSVLLPLDPVAPPLVVWDGGVVRIGTTRISLDLVVEQHENGMTPEDMVRAYDTLVLADVYAAIAYYLRHRDAVTAYMKRGELEAEARRKKIEAEQPQQARKGLAGIVGKWPGEETDEEVEQALRDLS